MKRGKSVDFTGYTAARAVPITIIERDGVCRLQQRLPQPAP
jgi:hypothetical protein